VDKIETVWFPLPFIPPTAGRGDLRRVSKKKLDINSQFLLCKNLLSSNLCARMDDFFHNTFNVLISKSFI